MTTANETPDEQADLSALFALAVREQRAGRLNEAAAAYHRILAVRPDSAKAHNNLGLVFCQAGQFDQAAASFQQAIALKPNLADAHSHLGRHFRRAWRRGSCRGPLRASLGFKARFVRYP